MASVNYENRFDNINRYDIFEKALIEWLETFKNEDVPMEKRIDDYSLTGSGMYESNSEKIAGNFKFAVTPSNPENTEWKTPENNIGFLEMSNVEGEFKIDYISNVPRNYDKFLADFEKWKTEQETTETIVVQGENEEIYSNLQINKLSNCITICCILMLSLAGIWMISKINKNTTRK